METKDLTEEIKVFGELWTGGYFEGDPQEPLARSTYRNLGYISVLYATYLRCIRPYVGPETIALEIGPGRGAWTRSLLAAREVWAIDASSAEHTGFFEYLGHPKNARYFQVSDFECSDLPDGHFDYMFSFGCLCHVSFDGIEAYAKNLFAKLKPGSSCFWMVADKVQYEAFVAEAERFDIWKQIAPTQGKFAMLRRLFDVFSRATSPGFLKVDPFAPGDGAWFDAGRDRTCEMLEGTGYKIVEKDVGTVPRDPIIHFVRP